MEDLGGRPTQYRIKHNDIVFKLCLLGATDEEIADIFEVTETTINNWKIKHPKFFESIKAGKKTADAEIANKLYHRAKGYSHPDVHISNYMGDITITEIVKHYPPDPTSMIFWLKNRDPDLWRDMKAIEMTAKITQTKIIEYKRHKEELSDKTYDELVSEINQQITTDK